MAKRRPNGDGAVRKRADGRWEGQIVVGHKENGSPIYKSVFAKTQKELMPKLHAVINEYRDVELTEDSRITLGEWVERWLEKYAAPTVRENTLIGYKRHIEYILPILGDKPVRQITTTDVQKMYNKLKKEGRKVPHKIYGRGLSDATVRKLHMLFHEIMEAAVREHLTAKNPTCGTTVPKNNYKPMKVLNDAQLDSFMEAIRGEPLWYEFFYTEITTGLRKGEICGLNHKSV